MASVLIAICAVLALLCVVGSTMPHKRSKFKLSQQPDAQSATADDALPQADLASQSVGSAQTLESTISPKLLPIAYMPMLLTPEEVHEVQCFINCLIARRAQQGCITPANASAPCTPRVCPTEFIGSEQDEPADADSIYGSQRDSEWLLPLPTVPHFPLAGSDDGASSAAHLAHPLHSNPGASSAIQISHEPPACIAIASSVPSAEKVDFIVSDTSVLATLDDGEWLDPLPKPELHLDHIVWTLPSSGVHKKLPAERNRNPQLPCEQPNHIQPTENPASREMPQLQTLSQQILATPMCDLPYRDSPLDIFKKLKTLGLESNGADSLFVAASRLASCRPRAAEIDEALHNLIRESHIHAMKHNPDNAHPSWSTPELVNSASSLHIATDHIVTCHTVDKNRTCSAIGSQHPVHTSRLASHIGAPK